MVTNNLKNYSNEDIILLINGIEDGSILYNLNDLKAILAEVTSRKLGQKYIDFLADLIKKSLNNDNSPSETRLRRQVYKKEEDDEYDLDDGEHEKFPILSLLSSIYKVLGWVMLLSALAIATIFSITMFKDNLIIIAALMFGAVGVGTMFVLIFYAAAESIILKLEIEKHLRKRG